MKKSQITKNYRSMHWVFWSFSMMATFMPVVIYVFLAFFNDDVAETKKFTMGVMLTVALILVIANILLKYSLRSPIWL